MQSFRLPRCFSLRWYHSLGLITVNCFGDSAVSEKSHLYGIFCVRIVSFSHTYNVSSISIVESDWLFVPNSGSPPSLYFNATKLGAWSSTVDYIEVCQFETVFLV